MNILIFIITSCMFLSNISVGQEIGITEVIYQNGNTNIREELPMIGDIAFESIKIHLQLSQLHNSSGHVQEELTIIKTLEEMVKTDILGNLKLVNNKQEILTNYLNQSDSAIQEGTRLIDSLKQELALLQIEIKSCLVDKAIADKEYFENTNQYDQIGSQTAMERSISMDKCASENRIRYNAKSYLVGKAVFLTSVLQQKYNVLSTQQEILISYPEVVEDSMLLKLQLINETLKSYQF